MRIGRVRSFEVFGQGQHAGAILGRVDNESGISLCAFKRSALVTFVRKNACGSNGQCGQEDEDSFVSHVLGC